jgi:hypothetical protein
VFLVLVVGLYVLYRLAMTAVRRSGPLAEDRAWRRTGRVLGLALVIATVGLGGAALTLLPAYQMAGHTGRAHLSYREATRYSLPPRALIGLLAPGFYGRGPGNFWGPWDRVEVGYAGVATVALAAFGLMVHASWPPLRQRGCATSGRQGQQSLYRFPFVFFALLTPLAFLLAMGQYTPLYQLLYRFVPTFDKIRAPARMIVLGDLGLAALAAYGLDRLLRSEGDLRPHQMRVGLGAAAAAVLLVVVGLFQARTVPPPDRVAQATRSVIIAAALLGLSGMLIAFTRRSVWMGWLFPLLLAIDLIGLGSTVEIEPNDPTLGFQHPAVVAFLRRDPSLFRIEDNARAWQPDGALMHGLYDIGGVYNPLGLAPYEAYRWAVGERGGPLYNLLGVKYILADKSKPPGDRRLVPVYDAAPDIDVYLNTAALPRALFVTCQKVVSDHEAAWRAIHAPGFDPTKAVVLEQEQLEDIVAPVDCASSDKNGQISFVSYGANRMELRVKSGVEGWLLLSDVYYPGWRATVDGARARLLRADYVFRAVRVPAGEHTVEMTFGPWTWYAGLALSVSTWLALAVGAVVKLRSRRPSSRQQ